MQNIKLYFRYLLFLCISGCASRELTTAGERADGFELTITTPSQRQLLSRQDSLVSGSRMGTLPSINIDTGRQFQPIDGFGYTLTGGSAMLIHQMSGGARAALLRELFGSGDHSISVSYLRLSIGASDLNDSAFSYDDLPAGETDTAMLHFSLGPDTLHLVPLLQEIVAINPHIRLLGSPWSPPAWMKDNKSTKGGILLPQYYAAYAKYFVRYLRDMQNRGIPIDAITPQNEPLHPGNNPSLLMLATEQAAFIRDHLGPALRDAGLRTKIIVYDHNADRPDYPINVLNDARAKPFIDGSAFHLYAGEIEALSKVKEAHPDKNIYFTEQYTASTTDFSGDLPWHIRNLIIGAPRNWSRTVLEWNLANDPAFGPHTPGGCTTCKGALTISGDSVQRNVAYYIIAHASAFVPPGSVRLESNMPQDLPNVAYRRPDGRLVLIVMNEGYSDTPSNVKWGGQTLMVRLPGGAVGTLVF